MSTTASAPQTFLRIFCESAGQPGDCASNGSADQSLAIVIFVTRRCGMAAAAVLPVEARHAVSASFGDRLANECATWRRRRGPSKVPAPGPPAAGVATRGAARHIPRSRSAPRLPPPGVPRAGPRRPAGGVRAGVPAGCRPVGTETAGRRPPAGPNGRPRALRRTGAFRWEPKRRPGNVAPPGARRDPQRGGTGANRYFPTSHCCPRSSQRADAFALPPRAECRSIRRAGRARRAVRALGGAAGDPAVAPSTGHGRPGDHLGAGGRRVTACRREVPVAAGRIASQLAAVPLPGMRRPPGMSSSG